jgi:hypothetical protein
VRLENVTVNPVVLTEDTRQSTSTLPALLALEPLS